MPDGIQIRRLQVVGEREIRGLSEVLIDCVEGGASVSFMLPMTVEKARAFWSKTAESAARGERMIFVAEDGSGDIIGTVQVVLDLPENQPHRGDVSKMLVHRKARRLGVGAALMTAAEQGGIECWKNRARARHRQRRCRAFVSASGLAVQRHDSGFRAHARRGVLCHSFLLQELETATFMTASRRSLASSGEN